MESVQRPPVCGRNDYPALIGVKEHSCIAVLSYSGLNSRGGFRRPLLDTMGTRLFASTTSPDGTMSNAVISRDYCDGKSGH